MALLFTESVTEQEVVPSPKLFVDVLQSQWNQPGATSVSSSMDQKMYTVEQELEDLFKLPTFDVPMASLASSLLIQMRV